MTVGSVLQNNFFFIVCKLILDKNCLESDIVMVMERFDGTSWDMGDRILGSESESGQDLDRGGLTPDDESRMHDDLSRAFEKAQRLGLNPSGNVKKRFPRVL